MSSVLPEAPADGAGWLGLARRVCVVTGAASGIGAATARCLAEAGARVALVDRDAAGAARVADELSARGAETLALACDTSDEAQVRAAAERLQAHWGACHALVNNAGLLRSGRLESISLADWNHVLSVNLTGYLLCAREFGRLMQPGASMVHVASIASLFPQSGSGAYSAGKAGVLLLSRQFAVEWADRGVRSNAVCPGMIRTPLSAAFYEQPGVEAARSAVTASRRIGEPEDIAHAAAFLASPRSGYINAAELVVDGGMSSMLMDMVPRPGFNNNAPAGGARERA